MRLSPGDLTGATVRGHLKREQSGEYICLKWQLLSVSDLLANIVTGHQSSHYSSDAQAIIVKMYFAWFDILKLFFFFLQLIYINFQPWEIWLNKKEATSTTWSPLPTDGTVSVRGHRLPVISFLSRIYPLLTVALIVIGENCIFQNWIRKKQTQEEGKWRMWKSFPALLCPGTVLGTARSH